MLTVDPMTMGLEEETTWGKRGAKLVHNVHHVVFFEFIFGGEKFYNGRTGLYKTYEANYNFCIF